MTTIPTSFYVLFLFDLSLFVLYFRIELFYLIYQDLTDSGFRKDLLLLVGSPVFRWFLLYEEMEEVSDI